MLFTELKKIQDDDIEQALEERLKARGLDRRFYINPWAVPM